MRDSSFIHSFIHKIIIYIPYGKIIIYIPYGKIIIYLSTYNNSKIIIITIFNYLLILEYNSIITLLL